MPSKTRGRATKSSKENIGVRTKTKTSAKVLKSTRKPLSDKTNSASDDNASLCDKSKNPGASVPDTQLNEVCFDKVKRPRRDRRLPTRYKENEILTNLSKSFNTSKQESPEFKTPSPVQKKTNFVNNTHASNNRSKKSTVLAEKVQISPSKSPVKTLDCSIVKNRPKRICRLPSKFQDHSVSPNKYIPLQPINASTPFATKTKKVIKNNASTNVSDILDITPEEVPNLTTQNINKENIETVNTIQSSSPEKRPKRAIKAKKVYNENTDNSTNTPSVLPKKRVTRQKAISNGIRQKAVADTNNNAKKNNKVQESPSKLPGTPGKIFRTRERVLNKNISLRLLDDNKNQLKRDSSKLDVYEFTFDPNEEPPPAKKKKKKAAPRKPKPKTVTVKSNYDRILAAALANLKKTVAAKSSNTENIKHNGESTTIIKQNINTESINHNGGVTTTIKENANNINNQNIINNECVAITTVTDSINTENIKHYGEVSTTKQNVYNVDNNHIYTPANDEHSNSMKEKSIANEKNYHSVRVEDIARDFQINEDDHAIDYSPVNSPHQAITPSDDVQCSVQVQSTNPIDPLHLRDDSFFDEIPVASSSMNVSVRHPQASPWRVEFGSLPIKWQVNTYVKPNMTPAFESSFINFNDTKKKHVYTNIVTEAHDPIPHINDTSNLKQTSIISFIKEVVERNANKKNKKLTPVKTNSLFEDLPSTSIVHHKTPNKETPHNNNTNITPQTGKQSENSSSDMSNEKENSNMFNKENSTENVTSKDVDENVDKNKTYFGFDDIEDQENVSPIKKNDRARSLRSRTRGILQEINEHKGPTRAVTPVAAKSKPTQIKSNKNEMKSAAEPPMFPEVAVDNCTDSTNAQESCVSENLDTEDQSVHLFEDIDLLFIHHPKPSRKSYGKAKKVTFIQKPVVGSDDSSTSDQDVRGNNAAISSDEEDLNDLSFKLPTERPKKTIKKKKPKKQLSKKEEKEVEAWAAGFNSMCEDIDGFDLVVE